VPPEAAQIAEDIDNQIEEDAAAAGAESGADEAPQDTEEEVRVASLMGWKPESQWKGDKANWRPAKDFLAEVPEIMRNTRKSNERMKGQLDRIVAQVARLTAAEKRQMSAGQEHALEAAMEAGDIEGAKKILAAARSSGAGDAPEKPPALAAFEERNADWYGVDDEATAYAAMLDKRFAEQAGGVSDPDVHMRKVEAGVKRAFPELFKDGKPRDDDEPGERRRAPLVARSGRGGDRSRSSTAMTPADMSAAQRKAATDMGVTHADWVKAYNQMQKAS
jgi:hypothetical protein